MFPMAYISVTLPVKQKFCLTYLGSLTISSPTVFELTTSTNRDMKVYIKNLWKSYL